MTRPFKGTYPVTQTWGVNPSSYARFGLKGHNGVDYGTPMRTPIIAPHGGTILEVANDPQGYGLYVKIENDQEGSILAHLSRQDVKVGQVVKEGEQIGLSGTTGNSTGSHLHWGYYRKPRNKADGYSGTINPFPYLSENQDDENPLQACLTAHKKAVDDYALLEKEYKAKKEEWTATEKRLIQEKDQAIKDKEITIRNLQTKLSDNKVELSSCGTNLESANSNYKVYMKKATDLQNKVDDLERKLKTASDSLEEADKKLAEVSDNRQKLIEVEEALSKSEKRVKSETKKYEDTKELLNLLNKKIEKDYIPSVKQPILRAIQMAISTTDHWISLKEANDKKLASK